MHRPSVGFDGKYGRLPRLRIGIIIMQSQIQTLDGGLKSTIEFNANRRAGEQAVPRVPQMNSSSDSGDCRSTRDVQTQPLQPHFAG